MTECEYDVIQWEHVLWLSYCEKRRKIQVILIYVWKPCTKEKQLRAGEI